MFARGVSQMSSMGSLKAIRGADHSLAEIQVRKLELVFDSSTPLYWYDNNPFASLLWAAFSVTLPEGEKQFIRSVRYYESRVSDPDLKKRVQEFCQQEAQHARQHTVLNKFLIGQGLPVREVESELMKLIEKERRLSRKAQLALTVTAEHFTAMIADYFLSKHPEELDKMTPELARIWAWHALEEAEHKSVAFDVYMDIFGDRKYLHKLMLLQTWYISWQMSKDMARFALKTGDVFRPLSIAKGLWYFGRPNSILWSSLGDYLSFFGRDFHPWDHDNREAIRRMQKHLFA